MNQTTRTACPRCTTGRLNQYQEYPECYQCGYVDYSAPSLYQSNGSILSSGTRFIYRYIGDEPGLKDVTVKARMENRRYDGTPRVDENSSGSQLVPIPFCPFCGGEMLPSSLSGLRRDMLAKRYICEQRHRITLVIANYSVQGWR